MEVQAVWKGDMSFDASGGSGFHIPIDTSVDKGGNDEGARPMELILTGLASCTAMDVISILRKKQQVITDFKVLANAERAEDHPRVFTRIDIQFVVTGRNLDPVAVDRSIELSVTKYCSAYAMLVKAVPIHVSSTIKEEEKTSLSS